MKYLIQYIPSSIFQNDTIDVLIVEPILNQTKSSYLINEDVEFQLQYYDDYEVLLKQLKEMKDNLSVLTKNTEQNLTQIETQIVNGDIDANINQKESSRNSINIKPINYVISTFIPMAHADNPLSSSSFNVLNEIAKTKEKIQELREKINLINQNGTTDERLLYEIKDQIETISENLRSVSGNMTGVSLSAKSKQINNLAETFESMVTENVTEVQYDKWQEQNNVITAEIYDPQGKLIDTISQYEKVREGKFNIKLSPEKIVTPGMYHIKTTLQIDGKQYVMEDEFAWGLVSLNTKKSIYKPGEIADFVIVVLDNGGHPVCNSNLVMTVTDPQLQKSVLSSNDGITTNQECGLYDSIYHTNTEGNYTIDITAQTPNGATSFSTYFTVKQDFDYDIIRTAQSKIDPITNPNSFNVTINIESFIGSEPITIREFVPIHFNVTTNGAVENINGTQIITWEKSLIENKTSVSYKYSIPLIFPKLYTLGKVEIAQNNSTFTEARNWYVAADPLTIVEFEENLGFTDINEIAPYANSIILNENLGMEDNNFGPGTGTIILLTENLGITGSKLLVVNSPISLTENLGMTDTVTTSASVTQSLTENLGMTDTATASASVTQSLTENLGMTDTVTTSASRTQALTENLGMTDTATASASVTQSLTENLGMTDTVTTSASRTQALTENLGMTDTATASASVTQSLTENLGMTDTVTTSASVTQSLTENLGMTDTATASASVTQSLTENLGMTDTATASASVTQSLTENLGITDQITASASVTQSLTENLGMTDTATASASVTQSLTENLGMTDTVTTSASVTQSLTENLGMTDTATASASVTQSLTENLGMTDTATASASVTQSLTENLGITDQITASASVTQSLTENLGMTDTVTTSSFKNTSFDREPRHDRHCNCISFCHPVTDREPRHDRHRYHISFCHPVTDREPRHDRHCNCISFCHPVTHREPRHD
ncbi:hypothetical protein QVH35_02875 [Candidatus Nitrosotenuis chungbukensis]|uniref:hypothetical protein n=1 Tax=Candidatus Nitrosotenuis chungbukensis TaxID=1353246 RepID=UPI002671E5C9|nr:hypothetical protein [Candidatus Nitrosotenuis chungbukensis]WKT58387.1 hypothetical protein QVH35_02875 [Candidatus Nitrosotenuis chungbukensis]